MPEWHQWLSHRAATAQGSQNTLNQFCGTRGGMERITWDHGGQYPQHRPCHQPMQCHPLLKRPSYILLLLSFKCISSLSAVWGFRHRASEEGWPPFRNNLPRMVGCVQARVVSMRWGQQTCLCHMSRSAAHGGGPSTSVMSPNARHAQKCVGDSRNMLLMPITVFPWLQRDISRSKSGITIPTRPQLLSRCL